MQRSGRVSPKPRKTPCETQPKTAQAALDKLTPEEVRAIGEAFDSERQSAQRRNESLALFLSAHSDIYVDA